MIGFAIFRKQLWAWTNAVNAPAMTVGKQAETSRCIGQMQSPRRRILRQSQTAHRRSGISQFGDSDAERGGGGGCFVFLRRGRGSRIGCVL